MTRAVGSFCSLLLVWIFGLGAGPAPRAVHARGSARSAGELALRDVAEAPRLAPRAVAPPSVTLRLAEHTAASPFPALFVPSPWRTTLHAVGAVLCGVGLVLPIRHEITVRRKQNVTGR